MKEKAILLLCVLVAIFCPTAIGKVIYVDDDAAGANDGTSWEDAYIYLQEALADANSAEKPVEIRVAQGIYKPDMGTGITPGDRDASFKLISGVSLSGGYAGIFEPDPNERDYEKYETILSGDLDGNDIYIENPNELNNEPTRQENSKYVITTDWPDSASVLDGFTVSGGNGKIPTSGGRGGGGRLGGGIRMGSGKLRIFKCVFTNNLSSDGAGIYVRYGQLTLTNCIFKVNEASSGGGIYNDGYGELKMVDCIFENNFAANKGGGVYNEDSKITIANTSFKNNSASDGGAIFSDNCLKDSSFNNSLFIGNLATNDGGAIYIEQNQNCLEITNSTFAQNSALYGKAIFSASDIKIKNSILYNGGQDEIWNNNLSTIEVSYSDIQNGQSSIYDPNGELIWGEGNIDINPLFADLNNGDYHLKSQAGRYDSITQSWLIDSNTSTCIDAGDPMLPIGLEPFSNGGVINMGAYGGTSEASKSYFGEPVCETIIAGDINGDCRVDFADIEILLQHWLEDGRPVSLKVINGIEFYIQTDKTFYKSGENVQIDFTITNNTNETVNIGCYQSPVFNIIMEKDGQEIWSLVQGFYQNMPVIEFYAGESKGISHSWDMKDNYGYSLGPGTYHIVGVMYIYNFVPEVRIPITISAANDP